MAESRQPYISWKNKLQELCHEKQRNPPTYTTVTNSDGLWVSTVTACDKSASGNAFERKIESEQCAAQMLFEMLVPRDGISSSSNPRIDSRSSREIITNLFQRSVDALQSSSQIQREFPNDIFNSEFLVHFQIIVQNKNIEIVDSPNYVTQDAHVTIHCVENSSIVSTLNSRGVKIIIPKLAGRESLQTSMILTLCMELGANACSVINIPHNQINRIIVSN